MALSRVAISSRAGFAVSAIACWQVIPARQPLAASTMPASCRHHGQRFPAVQVARPAGKAGLVVFTGWAQETGRVVCQAGGLGHALQHRVLS